MASDREYSTIGGRLARYGRVGMAVGGTAARLAGNRYLGTGLDRGRHAADLKAAILKEFTMPDGTLAYYKDRHGKIMSNREILGTAFAAIFGIVEGEAAKKAY